MAYASAQLLQAVKRLVITDVGPRNPRGLTKVQLLGHVNAAQLEALRRAVFADATLNGEDDQ